jgi:hypothetical protein
MFTNTKKSRISSLKLGTVGAAAIAALVVAPTALAATSGGASLAPAAHTAKMSSPFTIGLSAKAVKPGATVTISGLAAARAGLNVTITSKAIASARTVNGIAAVQTPALVEGIYHTTVRIAPSTKPGVYSMALRFGNRQVASISDLRVLASGAKAASATSGNRCAGIVFSVLHNDSAGGAYLPAGSYNLSSSNMDCGSASADLTSFLAAAGKPIPDWTTTSSAAGKATFTASNSGLAFSLSRTR